MKSNRDQVYPPPKVGETPIEDDVYKNQSGSVDAARRDWSASSNRRKKSSFLGSVVAFVVPFVVVSILVGVYRSPFAPSFSLVSSAQDDENKTTSTQSPLIEKAVAQSIDVSGVSTFHDVEKMEQSDETSGQEFQNAKSESTASFDNDLLEAGQADSSKDSTLERQGDEGKILEEEGEKKESEPSLYDAPEKTRQALAQLEYQFLEIQKMDVRDPTRLLDLLSPLQEQANVISEKAVPELTKQTLSVLERIQSFQEMIDNNRNFFIQLQQFDHASLNPTTSRVFFEQYQNLSNTDKSASGIDAYRNDFTKVAYCIDQLEVVDLWNDFIEKYGESLARFRVSQDAARAAVEFVSQNKNLPGMPQEFERLIQRTPEWTFQLEHVVPTQRKILLRLETEISQKYWTFSPSADRCYYLPAPPREGLNDYVADAEGSIKQVEIPKDAKELKLSESKQTNFLRNLSAFARQIPDNLQTQDASKWYASWGAFLTRIQETDQLDPILQYVLMRDCVKLLASSDYYFQRRLEPLLRMLNIPKLEEGTSVDRFQTESQKLQELRQLAKSRLGFLPKNFLTVDKTTAQLDAQVERVAFDYRRIGWLDRDFADEWKCRSPDDIEIPEGDLYVLIPSEDNAQTFQWFKIGVSNGKRTTLKLATNNVPRGSIVFCRVNLSQEKKIAKRASVEQFFNR